MDLRDGIPPARAASYAGLAGLSIREVSRSPQLPRRMNTNAGSTTFSASGVGYLREDRSSPLTESWYGRVLVERVGGFATSDEWRRAYREINDFELMLVDSGMRLVKLFLHITADEQVRRFRDRLFDPLKRWKLTYDDFRNHASRSDYETAIEDMLANTSTTHAPWYLIPANNKPFGRIAAFRIISDRLGRDVSLEPRPIHPELLEQAKQVLGLSPSDIERASQPISPRTRPRRYGPKTGREIHKLFPQSKRK
jgi:hypothetical protein